MEAEINDLKKTKNTERIVRWQTVLREHVTYTNNLFLTLSIGTLGYLLSLLRSNEFNLYCTEKFFFTSGFIMISLSIILGFGTIFSRLTDFRTTVKKIKLDLANSDQFGSLEMKRLMDIYGCVTWAFLYGQFFTFAIAEILIFSAFIFMYSDKLF